MKSLSFKEKCVDLARNKGWMLESVTDSQAFYWVNWLQSSQWNSYEEIERAAFIVDGRRALLSFDEEQIEKMYYEFWRDMTRAIQTDELSKILFHYRESMMKKYGFDNTLDVGNYEFLTSFENDYDFPIYETTAFYDETEVEGVFYFDRWDVEALHRVNKNIQPPYGLSWEDLNFLTEGSYLFIVHNGKFYDERCIEGVESIFELPIYRELIKDYAIKKKNFNDEVKMSYKR